jgi:hypothetical protein
LKRDSIVHRAKNDRYPRYWRWTGGGTRRLARCSFTDPEYGQVGLTEEKARETYDVVTAVVRFDSTTRTIKLAAIAIAARMRVNDLAHIPLSFPTYAGVNDSRGGQSDTRIQSESELASASGRERLASILKERKDKP